MSTSVEDIIELYPEHKRALEQQLHGGRSVHASCFIGAPEGGQYGVASWYVQRVLGVESSHALDDLVHPDLLVVEPTDESPRLTIEMVRAAQVHLAAHPSQAPTRVLFIREADRLTVNAANALLKSLEEPHDNAAIVFTTAYPDRLPSTVLSRVQQWWVPPVPRETMRSLLPDREGADMEFALRYTQGRVQRAQRLIGEQAQELEADVAFWVDFLEADTAGRDEALQGRFLRAKDPAVTHRLGEMLDLLEGLLRDMLLYQYRCEGPRQYWKWGERLDRLADGSSQQVTARRLQVLRRLREWSAANVNKKMIFEYLTFVL